MGWTNPDTVHRASTGVVAPATWGDTVNDDLNYLYGDQFFTAVTFTNSWSNFGGTFASAGFRKVASRVVLRGLIKPGSLSTAAFTLPAGYRPPQDRTFFVFSGSIGSPAVGVVVITASSGAVTPTAGATVISLENIAFDTV